MATADRAGRRKRLAGVIGLFLAASAAGLGTVGCRVTEVDLQRWENTSHGPEKLKAVLLHDKYETPLRVSAAMSLIGMKPRSGRRVGINIAIETLAEVTPEARQAIVAQLVPALIEQLKKPAPVAQAGQPLPPDSSFPYKDAAFALLNSEKTVLISDEALKQQLRATLTAWALADFEHRQSNRQQAYGMEQLMRYLGASGVAGLPKLMTRDARAIDAMASLVADLGDAKAKEEASQALVAIATFIRSDEWTKVKKPELEAANAASKLAPTPEQFKAQLAQYQDEELFRVFAAMKKVGGKPTAAYLLGIAEKKEEDEKRRQAALAALEGKVDRTNADDIARLLKIAGSDAPDTVLDLALRRIGELPREVVIDKLYDIFKTDKWKVRRAAAATVLKMSTVKHIDEFMAKLPDARTKGFAIGEALSYGAMLGDLKEGKPLEALTGHFDKGSGSQRTSALAYWYTFGTKADLEAVQRFTADRTAAPVCDGDPDCKWTCEVAKEGAADPQKERESKDIKTVGDFVRYCILPAMQERAPEPKK